MPARTELDRLAAARPPIVDHPESIVGPAAEDEILRQILATAQGMTGRRTPARRLSRRPLIGLAAAAAVLAIAGGGALIRSATTQQHAHAQPGSGHRVASPAESLQADEVIAARAATAVDAASRTRILYVTAKYAAGTTAGGIAVMKNWSKGISGREKFFGTNGAMLDDASAVVSHGMQVRRFVDYTSRTWQTDSIAARSFGSGVPPGQQIRQLLAPTAAQLRRANGNRLLVNPRRSVKAVSVGGTRLILVTIRYSRPLPSGTADFMLPPLLGDLQVLPAAANGHQSVIAALVWLDRSTDLPVRAELTAPGGSVLIDGTFAWLSASPANLAELSPAPVPAGFRQTAEPAH
jgi:hypothetical protein